MLKIGTYNNFKTTVQGVKQPIICSFCNNQYSRHYLGERGEKICYFCYVLQNIGFIFENIVVCRSKVSTQKDIIQKMYNYIKKTSSMPNLKYYSGLIQILDLSVLEICRIIQNGGNTIINDLGIVIVFNDKTNIENAGFTTCLFDSDSDSDSNKNSNSNVNIDIDSDNNKNKKPITKYSFTDSELEIIKNVMRH